jgi:hypothetical protein
LSQGESEGKKYPVYFSEWIVGIQVKAHHAGKCEYQFEYNSICTASLSLSVCPPFPGFETLYL